MKVRYGCRGKVQYTDKRAAEFSAHRVNEKGGRAMAYRCRGCRFWHVGGVDGHGQEQRNKAHRRRLAELRAEA